LSGQEAEPVPWLPVTIVIGVSLIAYILLGQTTEANQATTTLALPTIAANLDAMTPVEPEAVDPALVAEGRQLFAEACAACHGPEGEGIETLGASLTESELVQTHKT